MRHDGMFEELGLKRATAEETEAYEKRERNKNQLKEQFNQPLSKEEYISNLKEMIIGFKDYLTDELQYHDSEIQKRLKGHIANVESHLKVKKFINLERHKSLFMDQIKSLLTYFKEKDKAIKKKHGSGATGFVYNLGVLEGFKEAINEFKYTPSKANQFKELGLKKKGIGKGWHGDPEGHSRASKKGKTNKKLSHDFQNYAKSKWTRGPEGKI